MKENDANFERNRILQKKKEAADKVIENKRIENDLEEELFSYQVAIKERRIYV